MAKKMYSFRLEDKHVKMIDYISENEKMTKAEFLEKSIENYFYKILEERSKDETKKMQDLEFAKSLNKDSLEELEKNLNNVFSKANELIEKNLISESKLNEIFQALKGGEKDE